MEWIINIHFDPLRTPSSIACFPQAEINHSNYSWDRLANMLYLCVCVCEVCRRKGGQKPTAHVSRSVYAGGGVGISASAHQEEDSRSAGKSHYYGKPWRITLSLHACAFALTCISVPLCCSNTSKSVFNCVHQGLNVCLHELLYPWSECKKTPVLVLSNGRAGIDC